MKKTILILSGIILLVIIAVVGCKKKEEPKPQYQIPAEVIQKTQEDIRFLKEAVKKDTRDVNAWIKLGNILMDTGHFNDAVDAYQKALQLNPKDVDVRVDMGTCYRNVGKPEKAIAEFRKALKINPNHLNAHKNLGVVMAYDLHDNTQAAKEFEKYLELAPNASDAEQVRQEVQRLKALK